MINLTPNYLLDIVTVTHNSGKYIRFHRDQIKDCTGVDFRHHIVDNASTDDSRDYATIQNPHNVGYALACNQGAAAGTGQLICFMNPDIIVHPWWHVEMINKLIYEDYAAVGPSLVDLGGMPWHLPADFLQGACYMVRRDIFELVGGLDPKYYFAGDDNEFFARLTALNWRWGRVKTPVVHVGGECTRRTSVYAQGAALHAAYHLQSDGVPL